MLERRGNLIANAAPQSHVARIITLRGLRFVVEAPILVAAEEERTIVVAPNERRVDVRQPLGQPEPGERLR